MKFNSSGNSFTLLIRDYSEQQLYAHGFYLALSTAMALNAWHWGDPKKNFNWEKNWQSIHSYYTRDAAEQLWSFDEKTPFEFHPTMKNVALYSVIKNFEEIVYQIGP